MMYKRQALDLFETMYTERTMRDHLDECLFLCKEGSKEADILHQLERDHNTRSNQAMMDLWQLGYDAFRDSRNNEIPTLMHGDVVVAYWDECEGIQEAAEPAGDAHMIA